MPCTRLTLCLLLLAVPLSPARASAPVISEIMYHPLDGTDPVDGDEYEFLELYNPGPTPCDLSGAYFSNGIDYLFTNSTVLLPGTYLVLVKNHSAFTNRYPGITNLAEGVYAGNLSNGGETLTLKDAWFSTLASVEYDDANGWPEAADGGGSSLFNINPSGDPNDPANWCSEARLNGTPGEPGLCASAAVVINEILAHTDAPDEDSIELLNISTNSVNIGGWFLSDDVHTRAKYQIPPTLLPPGGYAVFTESQFNNTNDPNALIPFALSELGDEAYLTKTDGASNAVQYIDGVRFEASENGVTLGRYPNGTGPLVFMDHPTLGSSNSPPRVGPLIISEIMYHPLSNDSREEYIEILNPNDSPIPLFDPDHPSHTWALEGAVTFSFPTGITLAAHQRILVTSTTDLPLFRSVYGISSNISIVGPWTGRLNNGGDDIRLLKPGSPETNLTPYILVERVEYEDEAPWPETPDGNGPSLERAQPNTYANTAANWFAGPSGGTPGFAPAGGLYNVHIAPVEPAPSQVFTMMVSFVGTSLPTHLMVQTGTDDGETNSWIMTDDGTQGDAIAGDGMYAVRITAPSADSWFYYRINAEGTNGASFSWPGTVTEFSATTSLTVRMSSGGFFTTLTPDPSWTSYTIPGTFTHDEKLYFYLNGEGEIWIDDVSMTDDLTGTEHVQNGNFELPMGTFTWAGTGNHAGSSITNPVIEHGNGILHILASGPGGSSSDSANCLYSPVVTEGDTGLLRFRARQVGTLKESWAWFPVGTPPPSPVVFNELMYHPYPSNDVPYEYIELHNTGTQAVDMSYWEIRGVGLTLPEGHVLEPGAYGVYAAEPATVMAAYGISNVTGNGSGQLQNNGETVRLVNPYGRVVEEMTYDDHPPWPLAADGYGPSLERIHPDLPANSHTAWRASVSPTHWEYAVWTSSISSANSGLHFYFPDSDGKCYIDNVSVVRIGESSERVSNGDFESGSVNWSFTGNHRFSRIEPGMGLSNSAALAVIGNTSRIIKEPPIIFHGHLGSNDVSSAQISTSKNDSYRISFWYRRAGRGQRLAVHADSFSTSLQLGNQGTPGRINSVAGWNRPFRILGLAAESAVNPTGQPITVRATCSDPALVSTVTLNYRLVTPGDYQYSDGHYASLTLADDGVPPDSFSGDGEFTGLIPPVHTNNTLVRFHVLATATNGFLFRYPHGDDPSVDEGCWVQSDIPQTNLPNWNILMDGGPDLENIILKACAVSPDGQVFTDIDLRHRGRYSGYDESGFALRMHRGRPLNAWFAPDQTGINFRGRNMSAGKFLRRIVNEYLSYTFYQRVGLPTPRFRHVCNWINGTPFITMSLEHPKEAYLDAYGISDQDLVTRYGYTGLQVLGGSVTLNNLDEALTDLEAKTGSEKPEAVRRHIAYEQVRHMLASLGVIMNGDQDFTWNTIEHRRVQDGRWHQYPWDADDAFRTNYVSHHPYIETPEFPGIYWDPGEPLEGDPLHNVLFSPISGNDAAYTLPYRFRHQISLWRLCHTLFTTNVIYPIIDQVTQLVHPAFQQIGASPGDISDLEDNLQEVKDFVPARRNFLLSGTWGDALPQVWNQPAPYDPSTVVITEFMPDPTGSGEYLEFYNTGNQTIDLSQWKLCIDQETYPIPFGTLIAPTSYLVIADTQLDLTNYFHNTLGTPDQLIRRYWSLPIWDASQVWTSATEFSTRIVEIPQLTLPNQGASIQLMDLLSNSVDLVTYSNSPSWNLLPGFAQEIADPLADNAPPEQWRPSILLGTPGFPNAAALDMDFDRMPDAWEQQIVDASGGSLSSTDEVHPDDDFDMDSLPNYWEFILGFNPVVADAGQTWIQIDRTNDLLCVEFPTRAVSGTGYSLYRNRHYTLQHNAALTSPGTWTAVSGCENLPGDGNPVIYTPTVPDPSRYYRYIATLEADTP